MTKSRIRALLVACWVAALPSSGVAWSAPLAIRDVTLIDGTGGPVRPGVTVLIDGGRIAAISSARPPKGARIIEGRGRYLLPGFIDSNVHLTVYGKPDRRDTSAKYGDRNEELGVEFAQRALKLGITTMIDSYGVLPPGIAVRDRIARGEVTGARLLVAGNIVGWGGPFSLTFSLTKESDLSFFQEKWNDLLTQGMGEELADMTPDELRVAMNAYLDKGVDVVKYGGTSHFLRPSLIGFSPEQQRVIVEETHKRGKPVQTHSTSPEGLRLSVEAGIDLIQHPELASRDLPDALVALIVKKDVLCGMRPNFFTGEARRKHLARRAEVEAAQAKLPPPSTGAERWRRFEALGEYEDIQWRNAKRLIAAGCRVTVATDSFFGDAPEFRRTPKPDYDEPGMGTVRAIEGLVELGMTPMQAIVAGTKNGAAAAFLSKELGTVEPGKVADLVLLDADPLADIRNIEKVSAVISGGKLVDRDRLPEAPIFMVKP
ncbi:amidohydrolase family protein [Sphingomonas sp.]|uniref:amidohydrolase family protein n=1 Tax=Sphingomonas sp. TaxID=28214 RepID=UPI003B3BDF1F